MKIAADCVGHLKGQISFFQQNYFTPQIHWGMDNAPFPFSFSYAFSSVTAFFFCRPNFFLEMQARNSTVEWS
jgi:hypothetical protein